MIQLVPIKNTLSHPTYLEDHARWRNESLRWTRENNKTTEREQRKYFENLPKNRNFFSIVSRGTYVGTCGLTDIDLTNKTAEFSLLIGSEYRRSGYGSLALKALLKYGFSHLGLHLIYGVTFRYPNGEINPGAKAYEKLGFQLDGILRKRYIKNGEFIDTLIYSITIDQFKA